MVSILNLAICQHIEKGYNHNYSGQSKSVMAQKWHTGQILEIAGKQCTLEAAISPGLRRLQYLKGSCNSSPSTTSCKKVIKMVCSQIQTV